MGNHLKDINLPDEEEKMTHSVDPSAEEDLQIEEVLRKVEILEKIEPAINDYCNRLDNMISTTNDIKKIIGTAVARYLVTGQQVLRFEADFLKHFDKALQEKIQAEFQKFTFDIEHTRKENVNDFNREIYNGWWFSNKVGWILYMSNIITILGAVLFCYLK